MSERDRIATAIASMNGTIREVAWNGVTDESHYAIDSIAAADAVLDVLPLPSAEVIAAMRALRDYAVANSFFKFDHPAECATVDAYLAALEDAE